MLSNLHTAAYAAAGIGHWKHRWDIFLSSEARVVSSVTDIVWLLIKEPQSRPCGLQSCSSASHGNGRPVLLRRRQWREKKFRTFCSWATMRRWKSIDRITFSRRTTVARSCCYTKRMHVAFFNYSKTFQQGRIHEEHCGSDSYARQRLVSE